MSSPDRPPPPRQGPAGYEALIARTKAELSAEFDFNKPFQTHRAPGSLDIMGGVAEFTGALVCRAPIDRWGEVISQQRADREIQVFSFNLFDEHKPFTFRIALDRLVKSTASELRAGFAEPGRRWAAYIAGCLAVLHWEKLVDLANPKVSGMNIAIQSDIPMHIGLGSSAALTAATMLNLLEHFRIQDQVDSSRLIGLCGAVERELVGNSPSIASQAASCMDLAEGTMLRMRCRPSLEIQPPVRLPAGFQIVGINSAIRDKNADERLARHLRAASIAHGEILSKMREMGRAAGRELIDDPMHGCLANLDPNDYKKFFRAYLLDPEIQGAADHHVLEAQRIRQFCQFIAEAQSLDPGDKQRYILMDKAGHLMYASHLSYMNDARLGSEECDLLAKLVREREKSSLYGARITGRGCGGTVAVLSEINTPANTAIAQIVEEFQRRTNTAAEVVRATNRSLP